MISLKHISTLTTFNQTKFSADSTDSSYFLGSDQTQIFQGTPDVKYNDWRSSCITYTRRVLCFE